MTSNVSLRRPMIELINPMFERVRLIDFFVEMHQKKKKKKFATMR